MLEGAKSIGAGAATIASAELLPVLETFLVPRFIPSRGIHHWLNNHSVTPFRGLLQPKLLHCPRRRRPFRSHSSSEVSADP
nr:ATPase subunit 9 [Thuja sutchuenensis]